MSNTDILDRLRGAPYMTSEIRRLAMEEIAKLRHELSLLKCKLPKARGVGLDAESPNHTGVLVTFERELTDNELREFHDMLMELTVYGG